MGGCAIVEFATSEGAAEAVATLNDTELSGRQIFVREDRETSNSSNTREPSSRGRHRNRHGGNEGGLHGNSNNNNNLSVSSDPESQPRRVYVGNLSWDVTWPELKDHMRAAGEVLRADVISEHNGRSKGCGIVEYSTEDEAQQAIATLTHTELHGRNIFVREDRERGGDGNDGSSIGCGIVVYQSARDAQRAIRELQETDLNGRPVRLREDRVAGSSGGKGEGRGKGNRNNRNR